jgi:peptide chain release factor 1
MDVLAHIQTFRKRFAEVEQMLSDPNAFADQKRYSELAREHARLRDTLAAADEYAKVRTEIAENEALLAAEKDAAMKELVQHDLDTLKKREAELFLALQAAVLPPDPNDSRNTIVEIRAGAGGEEAALFAADLYRMYSKYAESQGWKVETMDMSTSERGGLKEIIFSVLGNNVYRKLRYESGVHRVQRVPATEASGRIHTSTVTVAIMPEAEEVDVDIKPDDLDITVCRASGPGGQGVNTTDSAVQIVHKPTGVTVRCADERSQLKNKIKAMRVLRSRILEARQAEETAKYAAQRKSQVGTGERNERIRTYNFPQNRITDHRINLTIQNLPQVMEGDIEELINALIAKNVEEKLAALQQTT